MVRTCRLRVELARLVLALRRELLAVVQQVWHQADALPARPEVLVRSWRHAIHPSPHRKTGSREHHLQELIDHRMGKLEVTWR